jgi:hypothetical protein
MVRRKRSTWMAALSFALIALAVMAFAISSAAPVTAAMPKPRPTPTPTGDFLFSLNYKGEYWTDPSYLVRGDTGPHPGPHYALASYSGWFWTENTLAVISRNGFTGTVNLEVLNLPSGVTSELPSSIFVPQGDGVIIEVHLRASAAAALGDVSGVTLRGTSGSIVHTANLPTFTVVEQLPPLPG